MQATTTREYVNRHFDRYQLSDAQLYRIFRYRGKRIPQLKPLQSPKTPTTNPASDKAIDPIRASGQPGSESRIAALSAYYAAQMAQTDNAKSPFLAQNE